MDSSRSQPKNTILIYLTYIPSVDRQIMNMYIDTARKVISITCKAYDWSSWLNVKEQIKVAEYKKP
jgi:hypothetical protein